MPMKVRYTVHNGRIVAENRGGVERDYVPDPLGSTVALLDNTQTQTDSFSYWPHGDERTRTGLTTNAVRYSRVTGCYQDYSRRIYVRARVLDVSAGRWLSPDPLPVALTDLNLYRPVFGNPVSRTDPSGLWCVHVGAGCFGSDCDKDPTCPRRGGWGNNYGRCCGWAVWDPDYGPGKPNPGIDCI